MKKLLALFLLLPLFTAACKNSDTDIRPDKVYFFYSDTCPHCHDALDYINQKYPDLQLTMVNVANQGGYDLFTRCAAKFKLGRRIGTPLFCMGDNYIMGWAPQYQSRFDNYIKPFLRQK